MVFRKNARIIVGVHGEQRKKAPGRRQAVGTEKALFDGEAVIISVAYHRTTAAT
jgi:hypothetical protein